MQFTTIYRNGKSQYFFIKIDNPKEFNFLQPYFIITDIDHVRRRRILEMNCLFGGSVWYGRQTHGYGYSCSADVYGELINIIKTLYKDKLSEKAKKALNKINTHDEHIKLSNTLLNELCALNMEKLQEKYN